MIRTEGDGEVVRVDFRKKAEKRFKRADAERIAAQALAYMAQDDELIACFMVSTGLQPENIRKASASPSFLRGVLDYVMENEPVLRDFAREARVPPEQVAQAHEMLGGGIPRSVRWEL